MTSTSLMVNMPGFDHAVSLMKQYPDLLHVGIHLVTTAQYSIVKGLKTLTDENDHFIVIHRSLKRVIKVNLIWNIRLKWISF